MASDSPRTLDDVLAALGEVAAETGTEAYLVGGFVRDRLLGRPSKDIDVVTVGKDGAEFIAALARRLQWSPPQVFPRFGTAQTRGDGFIVEVVRARAESYDPESRKPDVRPGTLEEDILRRDFTVNALCQRFDGAIIDVTGRGRADLEARVLRTPLDPAETFAEDPLRLFRAARFVGQLGFSLAEGVLEAMLSTAPRTRILSVERISEEFQRLLLTEHADAGLRVLLQSRLLETVMPEIAAMHGIEQGGWHRWDVFEHSLHALMEVPSDPLLRWAALLHDVGKPPTHEVDAGGKHTFYDHPVVGGRLSRELMERLRMPNDLTENVARLVQLHLRPIQYRSDFSDSAVRRLIRDAGELRDAMLAVARADTSASNYPDTAGIEELEARMRQLDVSGAVGRRQAVLRGGAILALAPGRRPGPWVGAVQRRLEEAMLDGEIPAGDEAAASAWLSARPELLRPEAGEPG